MGKKKAKSGVIVKKYNQLHRFLASMLVLCFVITVISSAISGASLSWIIIKSVAVVCAIGLLGRILIKVWVFWDTLHEH